MQSKVWIIISALLFIAVFLTFWWNSPRLYPTPVSPPGQYPVEQQSQVQWAGALEFVPYTPSNDSGENDISHIYSYRTLDPKRMCGRRLYENNSFL